MANAGAAYAALRDQANLAEAGGLAKERAVLLLWVLRSVMGVDDFDAYEYVCDGDDDGGIDGLMLEQPTGESDTETLTIMQSKYPVAPSPVGRTSLEGLITAADKFRTAEGLAAFLQGKVNAQVRALIERFDLLDKLNAGAVTNGKLRLRLVFVTAGLLDGDASALVTAANAASGVGYLTVYDLNTLGPIAQSVMTPVVPDRKIEFSSLPQERLVIGESPNRILLAPVRATEIVLWPGITDRTLFGLNVRRELPRNLVRRQLDEAIRRKQDHPDFVAYHNGLTITCESLNPLGDHVELVGPSVVNGAQSVVALLAALTAGHLTEQLRVIVKVVETAARPGLAEQVSRRSNTQNPVNPRNLVANTPRQRRLAAEFDDRYPAYYYETKPDTKSPDAAAGRTVIQNDDAAQLICAIYVQEPWLAVKKNSLFEPENHPRIFGEETSAAHVVVAHETSEAIEARRDLFPDEYRKSWRLTRLVAAYLIGQLMRAAKDGSDERRVLEDPSWAADHLDRLREVLAALSKHAAATLKVRNDAKRSANEFDDFKVDFKRQEALLALKSEARAHFVYQQTLAD